MFRHCFPVAVLVSLCAAAAQPVGAQTTSSTGTHAAAKPAAGGIVNLNTASATDLEGLPGIGAKTAARIIEYRQKNGPFKKVEELMNVRGVGEKNFLKLKPQITVGTPKAEGNASSK
jgi:competence protein ComEA